MELLLVGTAATRREVRRGSPPAGVDASNGAGSAMGAAAAAAQAAVAAAVQAVAAAATQLCDVGQNAWRPLSQSPYPIWTGGWRVLGFC